jgi:hypothetical protein
MLPPNDFARKLDADLAAIGNGPDAFAQLIAALLRAESIENWQPSVGDWKDYEAYLDQLDAHRLGQTADSRLTNQERWTAWLARAPLPDDLTPSTGE